MLLQQIKCLGRIHQVKSLPLANLEAALYAIAETPPAAKELLVADLAEDAALGKGLIPGQPVEFFGYFDVAGIFCLIDIPLIRPHHGSVSENSFSPKSITLVTLPLLQLQGCSKEIVIGGEDWCWCFNTDLRLRRLKLSHRSHS